MKNPFKQLADYAIDRAGDRVAERIFERYGADMAAVFTNVTQALVPPTTSAETNEPPKPGLRSV